VKIVIRDIDAGFEKYGEPGTRWEAGNVRAGLGPAERQEKMMAREMLRQGGRSARIQAEVHAATRALLETLDRSTLTVPMIAEKAGVTPSTIYRRWGDIGDLLADVALAHMRPISDPAETGSMHSDIETFIIEYAEEMSSRIGREMLSDIIGSSSGGAAEQCCHYTIHHLETLRERAQQRGEVVFDVSSAMDKIVAPIVYHIMFRDREVTPDYCRALVSDFLAKDAGR
jgi:AcrR family transcriptional regulator